MILLENNSLSVPDESIRVSGHPGCPCPRPRLRHGDGVFAGGGPPLGRRMVVGHCHPAPGVLIMVARYIGDI